MGNALFFYIALLGNMLHDMLQGNENEKKGIELVDTTVGMNKELV